MGGGLGAPPPPPLSRGKLTPAGFKCNIPCSCCVSEVKVSQVQGTCPTHNLLKKYGLVQLSDKLEKGYSSHWMLPEVFSVCLETRGGSGLSIYLAFSSTYLRNAEDRAAMFMSRSSHVP